MMRVRPEFKIPRELINAQIALLLLRPMAADAVCLKKGIKGFRSVNGSSENKAGD
jgi:hypothetical protein